RRAIGEILGQIIKRTGTETIEKELNEKFLDNRPYIIRNLIELLVFIHNQSLVILLARLLNNEDADVRSKVVFALGRIGGKDSFQLLARALEDEDKDICIKALKVLGKVGEKTTIDILKKYASRKDIAIEVAEAIKNIEKRISEKKEN
ncbi:MAG: HEAT repeat domain-containing protein, partial [Candidatus Omnitrophica bacterium]|nr:HEAT repeat domain-containing protein [Candidatus Omnitrophota bacterium]